MQKLCPETCGKSDCEVQEIELNENEVQDELPNCDKISHMCDEEEHKKFMGEYCAKTCSNGGDSEHSTSCEDKMDVCEKMTDFCDNDFTKKSCPKTCGVCYSPGFFRSGSFQKTCEDKKSNCSKFAKFCNFPGYSTMLGTVCKKTCGKC